MRVRLVLLALTLTPGAAAEGRQALRVATDWRVPAGNGCFSLTAFQAAVEAQLQREVFTGPLDADVKLTVSSGDSAIRSLELVLSRGGRPLGARSLQAEGQDCDHFRDTAALIVAMLLDTGAEQLARDEPSAAITPPPVPKPAAVIPPRRSPAKPASPAWNASSSISAAASSGLLPTTTFGVRGELGVERGWRLQPHLALEYWPDSTIEESDGSVSFRAGALALGVGWRLQSGSLRVLPRLELVTALVDAQATGFSESFDTAQWALSAAGGSRIEWQLGPRLFVSVDGAVRVMLLRPEFEYSTVLDFASGARQTPVFVSKFIGFQASAGAGVRF